MSYTIRLAEVGDAEAILKIYAPLIRETTVSFEIETPTLEEFTERVRSISGTYPYLVCEADGVVAGYAYAARYKERAAYCYDVETSIYIAPEYHGTSIAERLYDGLFDFLRILGYYVAYAIYTVPNEKSRRFHEKAGFYYIGENRRTGYKLGKWLDVVWMERVISEFRDDPEPVRSISDLTPGEIDAVLGKYNG